MAKILPQEIEVWYLLPALRRELSKCFVKEHKVTQKKAATILGVTEASISHYLKSKRANEIVFNQKEIKAIKQTADKIINDEKNLLKYFHALCCQMRGSKCMCDFHRKQDKDLPCKCSICLDK